TTSGNCSADTCPLKDCSHSRRIRPLGCPLSSTELESHRAKTYDSYTTPVDAICLALRAAYGCAHRLSCRCVEPTSTWVLNPTTAKQKRPSVRAFFIWRRGWDDTRHLHVPRPSGSLRLCTSA